MLYVVWNQQFCLRNITNFNNTFLQILRVLFHHRCSPVFKDFELHVILLFLQEVAQEIEKVCDPLKAKSAILFATDQSASIQDVRRKTDKSKTVKGYKIPKCWLNTSMPVRAIEFLFLEITCFNKCCLVNMMRYDV